jgi:hypothetical protein
MVRTGPLVSQTLAQARVSVRREVKHGSRRALEDAYEKAWGELDSKIRGAEGEAWLILIDTFLGSSLYNGPREPTTPELVELKQAPELLL